MSGTIGITGGSGFVGTHLTAHLVKKGYNVVIFTRSPVAHAPQKGVRYAIWHPDTGKCDLRQLRQLTGVVNLAGSNLMDGRWTDKRKKQIVSSRVETTSFLIDRLRDSAPDCKTLISASATGFYGPDIPGRKPFTEEAPAANDFLGQVCKAWEDEAHKAEDFLRTVIIRLGIVMGKDAGAFKSFALPQSFGIVPILGGGNQTVSWIHIDDLAELIVHALQHKDLSGIYNAVTPNPSTNREVMKTIAKEKGGIKIPVPVPAALLKLGLGEMSTEVLKSFTVSSDKIVSAGYKFQFPTIGEAVKDLLGKG